MKRRTLILVAVFFTASLILSACGAPVQSGPLTVIIGSDEGLLTPVNYNTDTGYRMLGWVYDSLYTLDPDLNPVPSLATNAALSTDGLTWQIALRKDIRWHDGQPFTAQDVIFSYQFLKDSGQARNLSVIDSMEARGDFALIINLSQPYAFFMNDVLAHYYIMPQHLWGNQQAVSGAPIDFQGTIGTGAYKLTEVVAGQSYTFEANSDYFRGQPQVPGIVAKVVTDPAQQVEQLGSRQAAAMLSSATPDQVAGLTGTTGVQLSTGSDFTNYVLYTNGSRPPFDQTKMREAILLAIDSQTLVDTVLQGHGTALPSSYYDPELPWAIDVPYDYDPVAAQALLGFVGVTDSNGDGIREWDGAPTDFAILCDSNDPFEVQASDLIVGWLKDVGIGAHQDCQDLTTETSAIWPNHVAVANPNYDIAIWRWSRETQLQRGFLQYMIADPATLGWANLSGLVDAQLQSEMAQYALTVDPSALDVASGNVQMTFSNVVPMIPLVAPEGNFAYKPAAYDGWVYVKGVGITTVWSFLPAPAATPTP